MGWVLEMPLDLQNHRIGLEGDLFRVPQDTRFATYINLALHIRLHEHHRNRNIVVHLVLFALLCELTYLFGCDITVVLGVDLNAID